MKIEKQETFTLTVSRNEMIELWNVIVMARVNGNKIITDKFIEIFKEYIE